MLCFRCKLILKKKNNRRWRRPASPQGQQAYKASKPTRPASLQGQQAHRLTFHLFLPALYWITPHIIEFTWEAWLVCPTECMLSPSSRNASDHCPINELTNLTWQAWPWIALQPRDIGSKLPFGALKAWFLLFFGQTAATWEHISIFLEFFFFIFPL